ncbi:hypothetical protein Patl1_24854 [Pistacia atlantica]|uniref:Uncharacterized protein n=1 Tax=Pistacia atlantica TaxID=434234 RepID=A0ACC1B4M6_9ROSI|nr:hypothetical protein Patl1_24854 [Pistacia atlantica]
MKTLLVLFAAFLLVMASLPADAKRIVLEEKYKKMVERQPIVSEKYGSSRCIVTDAKDAERLTATSDDDDKNPTHNNYGNPSRSTYHKFDVSDFIPAATITSSSSSSSSSVAAASHEGAKVAASPRAPGGSCYIILCLTDGILQFMGFIQFNFFLINSQACINYLIIFITKTNCVSVDRVIAAISTIMKTSVIFFVAFLLVLASLQADAKRHTLEEKHKRRVSDERQLLSETNTVSRNANTGAADDDNEANPTNNKYGNPTGSSSDSHHYYTNDQQPKN